MTFGTLIQFLPQILLGGGGAGRVVGFGDRFHMM